MRKSAILVLADGSVFEGVSIGYSGITIGEVVFNTSMTGYQEILSDPSYCKQIITLTYPHIGNTGVTTADQEANKIYASGLIIRDLSLVASNFRSQESLEDYLIRQQIVAIADIDTRRLTRLLRDKGVQAGCIVSDNTITVAEARQKAQQFGSIAGMDLAKVVTTPITYTWSEGEWSLGNKLTAPKPLYHIVAYDFGVKHNILRMLVQRACKVTVVPAQTSADDVLALNPDGVFLSNGPGDPEPCRYAILAIEQLLKQRIPLFGICLGHQLLGLALGGKTKKMKFGHHGANHPVQELSTGQVAITAQNHGFELAADSLPAHVEITHQSLFDGSLQGIRVKNTPAFSFQGHPEASSGPHDIAYLFDQFIDNIKQQAKG